MVWLVATLGACAVIAPRPAETQAQCPVIVQRAIAVRGGPIFNLRRGTEMRVNFGFPGTWHFEYVFRAPQTYLWTVFTTGEPNHYSWDGSTMRAAVGPIIVGSDTSGKAPLRSHARWHAVTYLDSLCEASIPARFRSLPTSAGGEIVVLVTLTDDDSRYRLTFDRHARLREARGPIEIPPFGKARLTQHYFDFRFADGFLIAHGTRYEIDGMPLSEERTTSFVANDAAIDRLLPISGPSE